MTLLRFQQADGNGNTSIFSYSISIIVNDTVKPTVYNTWTSYIEHIDKSGLT